MFDDENEAPEGEPQGCLHCMIWQTIHEWGGDELGPKEYRGALNALAMIMADVVSFSTQNGVSQDQIVSVFNAMFNEAMKAGGPSSHNDSGEDATTDLATTRVLN